jgi:hypothetical protein
LKKAYGVSSNGFVKRSGNERDSQDRQDEEQDGQDKGISDFEVLEEFGFPLLFSSCLSCTFLSCPSCELFWGKIISR